MALPKENIGDRIYNQCGLSKQKSIEVVESLLEGIEEKRHCYIDRLRYV